MNELARPPRLILFRSARRLYSVYQTLRADFGICSRKSEMRLAMNKANNR